MSSWRTDANFVCQTFNALRVPAEKGSRFAEFERILNRDFIQNDDEDFPGAVEAIRDVAQLTFIFRTLRGKISDDTLRRHLRLVVKDSILPQDDATETIGRNYQAELLVASICSNAGYQVKLTEPDVRVTTDHGDLGIACKRVKSEAQIDNHIRKAAIQIRDQGVPGIIFLHLGRVYNPKNEALGMIPEDAMKGAHHAATTRFFDDYLPHIVDWTRWKDVRGIIRYDDFVSQDSPTEWSLSSFWSNASLSPYSYTCKRRPRDFFNPIEIVNHHQFHEFHNRFTAGQPNAM